MLLSAEESQRLSRMLFQAREQLELWIDPDVVEILSNDMQAADMRELIRDIDLFRRQCGWDQHRYGGEEATAVGLTREEATRWMQRGREQT